jgi:hypothetical protein
MDLLGAKVCVGGGVGGGEGDVSYGENIIEEKTHREVPSVTILTTVCKEKSYD